MGRLTKLCQIGTIQEYIVAFEQLAICTKHLAEEFYIECLISGIKDPI